MREVAGQSSKVAPLQSSDTGGSRARGAARRLLCLLPAFLLLGCVLLAPPLKAPPATDEVDFGTPAGSGKGDARSQDATTAAPQGPLFGIVHDEAGQRQPTSRSARF
jgi:hypothetical protein